MVIKRILNTNQKQMAEQEPTHFNPELFLKVYEDVKRINHLDLVSSDLRYAKTLEEKGELDKECCRRLGRKVGSQDPESLKHGTLEEAADVIQCIYSLVEARVHFEELDFDPMDIPENLTDLAGTSMTMVDLMDDLNQGIGHLRNITLRPQNAAAAIDAVLEICREYEITLDQLHEHILNVKNPKWESSLEKLKQATT